MYNRYGISVLISVTVTAISVLLPIHFDLKKFHVVSSAVSQENIIEKTNNYAKAEVNAKQVSDKAWVTTALKKKAQIESALSRIRRDREQILATIVSNDLTNARLVEALARNQQQRLWLIEASRRTEKRKLRLSEILTRSEQEGLWLGELLIRLEQISSDLNRIDNEQIIIQEKTARNQEEEAWIIDDMSRMGSIVETLEESSQGLDDGILDHQEKAWISKSMKWKTEISHNLSQNKLQREKLNEETRKNEAEKRVICDDLARIARISTILTSSIGLPKHISREGEVEQKLLSDVVGSGLELSSGWPTLPELSYQKLKTQAILEGIKQSGNMSETGTEETKNRGLLPVQVDASVNETLSINEKDSEVQEKHTVVAEELEESGEEVVVLPTLEVDVTPVDSIEDVTS